MNLAKTKKLMTVFLAITLLFSYISLFSMSVNAIGGISPPEALTGTAPVAGFGNALHFAANKRLNIPFSDETSIGGGTDFTISMWAFPDDTGSYYTLYRQYQVNSGALGVWLRYINQYGGYLYCGFDIFGGAGWQWPWAWAIGPSADLPRIPPNEWFHVAMTKSGNLVTVYLNGEVYFEMTLDAAHRNAPAPTGATISVGGESQNSQYWNGKLDEVGYFDTALSQAEIRAWMFREIDSTHSKYENLACYYPLNQSSGTAVTDLTGTHHGTTVGMTDADWVASDIKTWTVRAGTNNTCQLVGSDADGTSHNGTDWNLTFEITTSPLHGTASVIGDNRFSYTVPLGSATTDSLTYRVRDADGNYSAPRTVYINILSIVSVTFETYGGSSVAEQSCSYGATVTPPATPTRDGYEFAGWYQDSDCQTPWVFAVNTVTADTVIYAKWDLVPVISVTVTWGSMEFTYTDGTWNPETHEYEDAGWTVEEDENKISVTSTSNVAVKVSYSYAQAPGYEALSGSFTDGAGPVTFRELAAGDTTPQSCAAYLVLKGKPPECNESKIGSITVTVTE